MPDDVLAGKQPQYDEHEMQKRRKVIQLRVITVRYAVGDVFVTARQVVSRWVQDYFEDFLDPQQRTKLVAFIEQDVALPFPSVATGMKLGLSQRQVQMISPSSTSRSSLSLRGNRRRTSGGGSR